MAEKLREVLGATSVNVEDISGGCGSMYSVAVESPKFAGVRLVKQHKMVKDALKEDIADMHALTVKTSTPKE